MQCIALIKLFGGKNNISASDKNKINAVAERTEPSACLLM